MKRYRRDRTRGYRAHAEIAIASPTKVISISLAESEIAALDAAAERASMARSHFIREAVKHYAAKLESK